MERKTTKNKEEINDKNNSREHRELRKQKTRTTTTTKTMNLPQRTQRPRRLVIGVGRTGLYPGPSPLRTVRAVLPHTALRSVVHPGGGWQAFAWAAVKENNPREAK